MNKQARILIGTIIAFLIIGAGLGAGWFFSTHKIVSVEEKTAQVIKDAGPNFNTYDISPPSRATTIETRDIDINPVGNAAFTLVPKKDAGDIKTGQKILLYTAEMQMLETLGEISSVRIGADEFADFVTVHMTLYGDETVSASLARHGRIIINRIPSSPRLPLTALIKNDKNEPYVWEAVQGQDGTTTAYFKRIHVAATTYDFFVIDDRTQHSGLYILNPDGDLRDGQKINVRKVLYAGPAQTEDSRIGVLMDTRRREREARIAFQNVQSPDAVTGEEMTSEGSCEPTPNVAKEFIEKIKSMSSTPATGTAPLPVDMP